MTSVQDASDYEKYSPRCDRDLPGGTLTGSGLDDVPKKDLVDVLGVEVDLGERVLDGDGSKLYGRQRRERAVERADGRPGRRYDVDGRLLSDGTGLDPRR